MEKNVVVVEVFNDELRCGTFSVAEGFGREHFKLLRLIDKHKDRFLRLDNKRFSKSFIIRQVPIKKAGHPVNEIMLNEKQSYFLGTLFRNTERVLDFKERLANDFVDQKNLLKSLIGQKQSPEWIKNRAMGKIARKEETDTIKDFVEYAKLQGSTHADRYYMILSKCVKTTMFDFVSKFKNSREGMTALQLIDAASANRVVSKGLIDGMAASMPYKEIYQLVKKRLITLAELHGKSEVISKQLTIE